MINNYSMPPSPSMCLRFRPGFFIPAANLLGVGPAPVKRLAGLKGTHDPKVRHNLSPHEALIRASGRGPPGSYKAASCCRTLLKILGQWQLTVPDQEQPVQQNNVCYAAKSAHCSCVKD